MAGSIYETVRFTCCEMYFFNFFFENVTLLKMFHFSRRHVYYCMILRNTEILVKYVVDDTTAVSRQPTFNIKRC